MLAPKDCCELLTVEGGFLMDICTEGTDTASPFSEEGTSSAVVDPVLSPWVSQRSLLPCHHNDSPLNGLVYLGHVNLGICESSLAIHQLIGTEKQVFLEVPLPEDRFCVYSRCKNSIKPRRKYGLHDLHLLVCFSPSPKAKKLLQYCAKAFTSCGFEMRWSTDENKELLMHIYLKLPFILYSDITCEVEKIRKLVRNGFNRCANTVLSVLYPELAESLNECSGRWFEKLYAKSRENFDTFFAMVRACRLNPPMYNLKLDGLKSRLHPFQKDAVNFLVHRELSSNDDHGELMRVINLPEQQDVHYFPYFGLFMRSRELCHGGFSTGGILADEMGLGKTVEILALIMSHTPESVPVLASMNENEEHSLDVNVRSCEIEADVTATVEFLKCSISAACEVEYMFPPRKRLPVSKTLLRTGDIVTCEACGVQYQTTEVHWSQALNSRMKRFTCPYCIEGADISFDVSTTLIVVPESLLHQWYEEIRRHCTEDVRIDVYYGVAYDGYKHPLYLESYDIVLCAYETLQREIHHVITTSPKELRKRAHPTAREYPSPLLALNFWRVCLDECQLVKNKVKAASKLCAMLRARHRWCVTGTPLSSSVNDLYGLLHFLGFFPYSIDAVWEHYIFYPYLKSTPTMMMSLISKLLWRNSKKDAWIQLENIVRQENLVLLSFTPIEERLYASKIESSKMKMYSLVCSLLRQNRLNSPLISLPSAKIDQIFSIINDVRLCIVAGESYKQLKDPNSLSGFRIFSQELIFRKLLEDATTLACQRYRDMIANRNALAGIHILMGDDFSALSWYKQAYNVHSEQVELNRLLGLQNEDVQMSAGLSEQVKDNNKEDIPKIQKESSSFSGPSRPCKSLRIDSLQIIHIGRNVESLAKTSENAKEFVESSGIADLARRSHQRYIRAEVVGVSRVRRRWCEADSLWLKANEEFDVARTCYVIMLDGFSGRISFDKFKASFPIPSISERFGSSVSSSDYLRLFDEDIYALREFYTNFRLAILSMLLPFMPKQEDSSSQITEEVLPLPRLELSEFTHMLTCRHNTPVNYGASVTSTHDVSENSHSSHFFPLPLVDSCPLCEVNGFLFKHDASEQIDPVLCRGKASAEYFVKQLWLSRRDLRSRAWSLYQKLINWFNVIEKLVSVGRELTVVIQEWVNREREIVVGATRLRLGMAVQFFPSAAPLILDSSNLDIALALCCQSEKDNAEAVSKSLSSLRYLNTLRRHSESHPDEVRECPCCYSEMKHVWVVFPCAHTVCRTCMEKLKSKSPSSRSMNCISCRQPCSVDATMYVVDNEHEPLSQIKITVKFENIIRLLKNLIAEDCSNKIIVFTSISAAIPPFEELLKLLKLPALVLSRGLKSDMLNKFRNNPKLKILLLPLRMGANGLNLTQANHVVFMEPITEMSVFAQAVGRIDRIGQRRAITVHNFIVRGSIEKEIYGIVSKGTEQSKWTLHTLCQVFGFNTQ